MPIDFMEYERRSQDAMRKIVHESSAMIARDGLIGDHHVYVVFDTRARGVGLSRKLREQFPAEMSVILQHQFAELKVDDKEFSVILSFGGAPEKIVVPLAAITAFTDPAVKFSVKFDSPANVNRQHGSTREPDQPKMLYCAFCGQPDDDLRKLAFGRGVGICNECVDRVAEEFRQEAETTVAAKTD